MKVFKINALDVAKFYDVVKGQVFDMLNYKKGIFTNNIRILSERFQLNQEAFNRPYFLRVPANRTFKNARMMNFGRSWPEFENY
ncbi:MAG: hypothetical protein ABIW38_07000 [Ferruginibacter sp.]